MLSALALALGGILAMLPSEPVAAKREPVTLDLTLELPSSRPPLEESTAELAVLTEAPWHEETVVSGDNLSKIFSRAGFSARELYAFLQAAPEAKQLRQIHPGHVIAFQRDGEGQLKALKYRRNELESLVFQRSEDGFTAEEQLRQPDVRTAYREATIDSSLFLAGQQSGMSENLIMELANIFGWDIDFVLDIRRGDSFAILWEEQFLDGKKIGDGAILAAEFTNQGETYRAVRYVHEDGSAQFYTPEGRSMRKEFLRTPVEFARISSHFNLRRKHPILHTIRAHKGTDYAAARGTPVRATGDGKVVFAGRKGGYGNTVIIQHGQTYRTLYAHLHKFRRGVRNGARVKQGQTIAYVGSTGLATGPHLHYEFYVNGAVRNPVTVQLPQAESIAKSELSDFLASTQPLMAQLDSYQERTRLAALDSEPQQLAQN